MQHPNRIQILFYNNIFISFYFKIIFDIFLILKLWNINFIKKNHQYIMHFKTFFILWNSNKNWTKGVSFMFSNDILLCFIWHKEGVKILIINILLLSQTYFYFPFICVKAYTAIGCACCQHVFCILTPAQYMYRDTSFGV